MKIDLKHVSSIVFFGESPKYLPKKSSEKIKLFVKTNPFTIFILTGGLALLIMYGLEVGKIGKAFSTVSGFIINHKQLVIGIGIASLILKIAYARGYWVGQKDNDSDYEFEGGIRESAILVAFGKASGALPEKTSEKIHTFVMANLHIIFVLVSGATLLAMYGFEADKMGKVFSSVSEFIANHKDLAIVTGVTVALFRIVHAIGYWLGQKDFSNQVYIRSGLLSALGITEQANAT